jgi:hypothetical protein
MYFKSEEDREYFVKRDPVHLELKAFTTPRIAKELLVLDFANGQSKRGQPPELC